MWPFKKKKKGKLAQIHDDILRRCGITSPDVVRVGIGLARITQVTSTQIEYIDKAGQERSVDLEECARSWCRYLDENRSDYMILDSNEPSESLDRWNARCAGLREATDNPPWVVFINEPGTRFEFKTYDEIYALLLEPLQLAGWHTFDLG